jgi:hypothetical protein
MFLLTVAFVGIASGYLSIWSTVFFQKTIEERVKTLLIGVATDVIMLLGFTYVGQGVLFVWILIFKYLFLAAIDFNRTLRQ